jgi:hypothetical protein
MDRPVGEGAWTIQDRDGRTEVVNPFHTEPDLLVAVET